MKIDLSKLASLRDAHARLHADYQSTSARARAAVSDAERLHREVVASTANDAARSILAEPLSKLCKLGKDKLTANGLDPRKVRSIVEAHSRATRLQEQARTLSERLSRSGTLMQGINDFAAPLEAVQ